MPLYLTEILSGCMASLSHYNVITTHIWFYLMWLNADKDTCYCTVFETPPVSQVASVLGVGSPLSGMNRQRGTRNS